MRKIEAMLVQRWELVAYAAAGVLTTIINYAVYSVLTVFGGLSVTISNIGAWVVSVGSAFFTNKAFVFRKRDWSLAAVLWEGAMFVGSRLLSGMASIGLMPVLMHFGITQSVFGIPGFAAKFLSECVGLVLSYIFSKYVIFKK